MDVETCESQTRELSVSSIADSLSAVLIFLFTLPRCQVVF